MSAAQNLPRIAIFGASGPSANATLVLALRAGYNVHALARTPQKLTDLLLKKNISQSTINNHLEITEGDVRDIEAVKNTLIVQGRPATKIFSGIGMSDADLFSFSKTAGHTVCEDATKTILQALRELNFSLKPQFVAISNRSISEGPRDYPLLQTPIYYLIVARPARDKLAMENLITSAQEEGLISSYTLVRPSILSAGASLGMSSIRSGVEDAPAVGYSISKEDLGLWIWEEVLSASEENWKNQKPSITY